MTEPRRLPRSFTSLLLACVFSGCGSDSPTSPTPPASQTPTVASVSPSSGSTLGGTTITVSGNHFAAGATVSIGGAAASNVVVQNATTLTATTAQRAAGAADVVVAVGALSGRLTSGFTYQAPNTSANAPPTISGITAQDQRRGAPRNFADLDSVVDLTAFVQDAETPLPDLRYEWSAEAGSVEGSGPTARWRAPAQFATPGNVRVTITVIETYQGLSDQGLPEPREHRVTSEVVVSLHDSVKEVRDLAVQFLIDFSEQRLSPDQVIRNFTTACAGRNRELNDVRDNQRDFVINSYTIGPNPPVDVTFGAVCRYRGESGDACTYVPVRWNSTKKNDGSAERTQGVDQVAAVLDGTTWRLCSSEFIPDATSTGTAFRH